MNVLVIMARGICGKWKQPVYYDFDSTLSKELLFQVIRSIEDVGLKVYALVSDLGSANRKLHGSLAINPERTFFEHPSDSRRKVHVFADIPHMLKLMRNHFLDSGLRQQSGNICSKNKIKEILDADKSEFRLCPKLKSDHISLQAMARQKVLPAVQLFSNHTEKALQFLLRDEESAAAFQIINDGFDVMNSRFPKDPNQ